MLRCGAELDALLSKSKATVDCLLPDYYYYYFHLFHYMPVRGEKLTAGSTCINLEVVRTQKINAPNHVFFNSSDLLGHYVLQIASSIQFSLLFFCTPQDMWAQHKLNLHFSCFLLECIKSINKKLL